MQKKINKERKALHSFFISATQNDHGPHEEALGAESCNALVSQLVLPINWSNWFDQLSAIHN